MKAANLALRFLLELCALAALAYWGAHWGRSATLRIVLAVAAPVVMIVLWGLFVAPKSVFQIAPRVKWVLGLALLEASALALGYSGHPTLAIAFAILIILNALPLLGH